MIGYDIVDLAGNFSGNDLVLKHRKHSEHGNIIGRKEKLDLILHEIDLLSNEQVKLDKKSRRIIKLSAEDGQTNFFEIRGTGNLISKWFEAEKNSERIKTDTN